MSKCYGVAEGSNCNVPRKPGTKIERTGLTKGRTSITCPNDQEKRHIVTDTLGLMLFVLIHAANIQDRDGAVDLIKAIRYRFPWLRHLFADGGYQGEKLGLALAGLGRWTLEIVKRSDADKGFVVLPRRWVVERTFAWLGRCRRLAKDFERSIESSTAWTTIAHVRRLSRLIARHCFAS